ncbi:DUF2997 domain-containing protein [Haliangium sp.]|uniref:DUF2997 domain-containing protein n=1 Tax=Haliangium sp. TaxID=2663208 RepID=UPI003D127E2A
MRKQDIEISISPSGEVTFQVKGVKGASCLDETKFLEEALGGGVIEQERTPEYYQQPDESYISSYAGGDDDDD